MTSVALTHTRKLAGVQVFLASEAMELSRYAETLSGGAKELYLEKINLLGCRDPFCGPQGKSTDCVPSVEASDLVAYLVLTTSFLTAKQFKAYKGLESYNQFVCGWVKDVQVWRNEEKYVASGKVS